MKSFRKQVDMILKFDNDIYLKSGNRPALWVIWFFFFLFSCFMPFMENFEAHIFVGVISFIIQLIAYSGTVVAIGENGRFVRLEVCRLYNLNINAYIVSKLIMVAKATAVTAAILAVVTIVEFKVTEWDSFFGCIFWMIAAYLANVVIVVINEKIRDNAKIR